MTDVAMVVPDHRKLDALNAELAIIRRLLNRPHVASAPEVMDLVRMGVDYTHSRMEALAFEMRSAAMAMNAK